MGQLLVTIDPPRSLGQHQSLMYSVTTRHRAMVIDRISFPHGTDIEGITATYDGEPIAVTVDDPLPKRPMEEDENDYWDDDDDTMGWF